MNQLSAGPSTLYSFQFAQDVPIQPFQFFQNSQYLNDVPATPNRECEAVPAPLFPIERGLSARGREKLPASIEQDASALAEGLKADLSSNLEEKKQEEERREKETKALTDLTGEVEKVIRKVYHLSNPGTYWGCKGKETREREDDASTTAVARSEQEREAIAKSDELMHSHSNSQNFKSDSHNVALVTNPSTAIQDPLAKKKAIQAWIADVHVQCNGETDLPAPQWATKIGSSPCSDADRSSYEDTLVGDESIVPEKLAGDENVEDDIERMSLTAEIPMGAYITELVRRTAISVSQLKVAACYLIALNPTIQTLLDTKRKAATVIAAGFPVNNYTVSPLLCARRTLVSCLIMASKFLGDNVYTMKAWSRITGMEAPDLVQCECAIGVALGWRMWVGANINNLKNDVFTRTLAQAKAPIPTPPELVVPQASACAQLSVQVLQTVLPVVPAAYGEPRSAPKETTVTKKRSRALTSTGSDREIDLRVHKKKVVERFSLPMGRPIGCATGMVMPEQVEEHRLMAEAY
ncbi:hypothetical protein DACRYDRAFT_88241 [Dacryopinax primogenitus]|uniref:Uncharacterized protein n=1 Tax=Dacryopinax primogenitus (strain DJM 731) TaxID=1858805 RepID=M5GEI0_DACPD|nr:uncharacterized protein DACRYDRAFT_88241 [Dacryopinax primogenitus]EJU03273.1 hypothetical protein DACRYDRAFT_88241 [Dacryopinax primogenitus]